MKLKAITIEYLYVKCRPGQDIVDCAKEAIVLSVQEDRPVELIHNDHTYAIHPTALTYHVINELKRN